MQQLEKPKYNVVSIINDAKDKEGKDFTNYIAFIMKESQKELIEDLYKELGKDFLLKFFEKALTVENNTGMERKIPRKKKELEENEKTNNEQTILKRTIGGIFFFLIRNNEKQNLFVKTIFKNHAKKTQKVKKLAKKFEKIDFGL